MDRLATVAIVVAVLATASSALHVGGLGPAIPLTAPECRQGDFGASDCHANVTKVNPDHVSARMFPSRC